MATVSSKSLLDNGVAIPLLYVNDKNLINNRSIGIDFEIVSNYTATGFGTVSVVGTLTVAGDFNIISV